MVEEILKDLRTLSLRGPIKSVRDGSNNSIGLTFRNADGKKDFVRLLFGAISLLFCLRVLFFDILGG